MPEMPEAMGKVWMMGAVGATRVGSMEKRSGTLIEVMRSLLLARTDVFDEGIFGEGVDVADGRVGGPAAAGGVGTAGRGDEGRDVERWSHCEGWVKRVGSLENTATRGRVRWVLMVLHVVLPGGNFVSLEVPWKRNNGTLVATIGSNQGSFAEDVQNEA